MHTCYSTKENFGEKKYGLKIVFEILGQMFYVIQVGKAAKAVAQGCHAVDSKWRGIFHCDFVFSALGKS